MHSSAANLFLEPAPRAFVLCFTKPEAVMFLSGVNYFALNAGRSVNDSNMLVETVSAQVIAVACSSADKTPTRARGDFFGPLREVH